MIVSTSDAHGAATNTDATELGLQGWGDTHAVSQVPPDLGKESQGLLARLSHPLRCGVCEHGDGEVQLSLHQGDPVRYLQARASWLQIRSCLRAQMKGVLPGGGVSLP